jgi:nucleoside phosphorylase
MPRAVDTLIITALAEEGVAAVRALGNCTVRSSHGIDLHEGSVHGRTVLVVALGAMGNASSAQAVQKAIADWRPARLMIVGITGGARDADDVRLGDVLIADQIVGYEHAKLQPKGSQPRYETYRAAHDLLEIAKSVRPEEWTPRIVVPRPDGDSGRVLPRAHIGPVFSGEKVIADSSTMRRLRTAWPLALGVEMEGLGVAVASYRGGPGFLLVKAVSDFADPTKDNSWRAYAAEAAARFAVAVLARRLETPSDPGSQAVRADGAVRYSGKAKVEFCRRLGADWRAVADFLGLPPYATAQFTRGNEPRHLWEYLEMREQLSALPEVLDLTGRPEIADLLRADLLRAEAT